MKKFKRLFILPAVIVLCMSVILGNVMTAFAAPVTDTDDDVFKIPAFKTTYAVGDIVEFEGLDVANVELTVKDPVGRDVTLNSDKLSFNPTMAGYYVVSFEKGAAKYDKLIIKVEADSAVLKIPYNGAEIPTYTKVGAESKVEFTVPVAKVVEYDEDDSSVFEDVSSEYTISYKVTGPSGAVTSTEVKNDTDVTVGHKFSSTQGKGTYLVRFEAKKNGSDSVITSNFTVNAVEDFADTEKPKLSMMSVSNSLPQRVKYTLPTATATDDYDSNVKITVSVTDKDGKAVVVVEEENGKLVKKDEAVKFDNDKQMSFYPWEAGTYKIEYVATDDVGNSAKSVYNVTVADNRAPVIDTETLPTSINWGVNVAKELNAGANPTPKWISMPLSIKIPEVTDNVSTLPEGKELLADKDTVVGANEIKLFYSLKDNSKTGTDATLFDSRNQNHDSKDIIKYNKDNKTLDLTFVNTGTYTLTLTARDTDANGSYDNSSSKVVSIVVTDEYVDATAPEVTEVKNLPQYIFVGDKFVAPAISVQDLYGEGNDLKNSSGLIKEIDYEFVPTVGETQVILKDETYFRPKTSGVINLTIKLTDSVGHELAVPYSRTVAVYSDEDVDGTDELTVDNGTMSTSGLKIVDKKALIEDVVISAPSNNNNFLGYELIVKEGDSVISTKVVSYNAVAGSNDTLVLKNILFDVKTAGSELTETYTVTLRAFRINGESVVSTVVYDNTTTLDDSGSAFDLTADINRDKTVSELEVLEGYRLPTAADIDIDSNFRVISGVSYSLHGNIFTPKYMGENYSIELYSYGATEFNKNAEGKVVKYTLESANSKVTSVNKSSIEVGVSSDVEQYKAKWEGEQNINVDVDEAKDGFVKIPEINKYVNKANALNGNPLVEATVTVTDRKGNSAQIYRIDGTKLATVAPKSFLTIADYKYFRPDVDGKYTISYKLSDASTTSNIVVGDLIMPWITNLSSIAPKSSYTQGSKLTLVKVVAADNLTAVDDLTINTKLSSRSGALISVETDDDGNEFYTLTDSGTYTLVYEVIDEAGNKYVKQFSFSVNAKTNPVNYELLSTVLIVAAVVLIVGVGVYFFRFKKIKE